MRKSFYFFVLSLVYMSLSYGQEPIAWIASVAQSGGNVFDGPSVIAITPDGTKAYVANYNDTSGVSSVSVVDIATNTLIATVSDPENTFYYPWGIAITPDGQKAYISNFYGNSVSVVDVATNAVVGLVSGTFRAPWGIAITPDGQKAYIANYSNSVVSIVDVTTNTVTGNVTISDSAGTFQVPAQIAITPDGQYAYVTNYRGVLPELCKISIIDVATNTVTGIVSDPDQTLYNPWAIAITPDGKRAYVIDYAGGVRNYGSVSVVDLDPSSITYNTVIANIGANDANLDVGQGLAITPDGHYVIVPQQSTGPSNNLMLINNTSSSFSYTFVAGPGDNPDYLNVAIVTRNDQICAYVSDGQNNQVDIFFLGAVPTPPTPPTHKTNFVGSKRQNQFLIQTDNYNHLTWQVQSTAVVYRIYRDSALTQLVATVPAPQLYYNDHVRDSFESYTYYLVGVDASGNVSTPSSTTV